ncbi:MAG: type IV pili twitching motility protein PilT [Acidobacteria bacterium RBG_16_68_9]|nr:MAG: type IV pili twitching motility protein PilT [Acidobacteria bacterium RBG_16_68_9]
MELSEILTEAIRNDASDVLLKAGVPPAFRLGADLLPLEGAEPLTPECLVRIVDGLVDDVRRPRLQAEMQVDLAYEHPDLGRFRINIFRQRGLLSLVVRVIKTDIRNIAALNLPPVVERLANERRGLILATGTTGSGKSTTLAAMTDHINRTRQSHIITIEDPIEYVHRDRMSFVNQREIGYDATGFASALKSALRQNPDVILVGEMRDLETIETAIMAAETGHLVMSTLHTLDAPETITRTISAFPEDQREQVRLILASVLKGIISQRLIPRADKHGMVPAVEVLISTARVREYVADKSKSPELRDVIAQGHTAYGMQTFDQSLMSLFRSGLITYDEALLHCSNVTDFELKVRGIASTSDSRWNNFERDEESDDSGDRGKLDIERF